MIQGIGVGHRRALEDFVRAVDVTELKPVIEHRYRFNQLAQALEHLDRGAFGKIVLTRSEPRSRILPKGILLRNVALFLWA